MKRLFLIALIFVFALPAIITVNAAKPDIIVDFSTQEGFNAYVAALDQAVSYKNAMDTYCTYEYKDGFTRFTSKKTGDVWMTVQISIPTDEYKFIAIKYRASDKIASNNIYSKDDTGNKGYSPTQGTWVGTAMVGDNTWRVRIINISTELSAATGTITGLRIPIVDKIDGTLDFEYIAAFKTQEEANAFIEGKEPNTETGVVSILPALSVAAGAALCVAKKREW